MNEEAKRIIGDMIVSVNQMQVLSKVSDQAVLDLLIREVILGNDTLTQQKRTIIAEAGDRLRWRINGRATGSYVPALSDIGSYLNPRHPNPAKLPKPSHVGRRIRTADGREGIIRSEWVNGDDCSSGYGTLRYDLVGDTHGTQNNSCSIDAATCTILD